MRRPGDWTTEIPVHKRKDVASTIVPHLWEPSQTAAAELNEVLNLWEATHHLMVYETCQCIKVEMPETSVPKPWLVILTHPQAHGLHKMKITTYSR